MIHDITYYRLLQGTNGVENEKQAKVRAYRDRITEDFSRTLNWEEVFINHAEDSQEVQIVPLSDPFTKKIIGKPGENLKLGDIIGWKNTYWIVNALNADDTLGSYGTMVQCNILLRWQLDDGSIHEEYGWDKDGSKYAFGETQNTYMDVANFVMKAIVQVNAETLKIERGKRFLLGPCGEGMHPLAVEASRLNVVTNTYQYDGNSAQENSGLLEITLHETQFREGVDNVQLGIADYRPADEDGEHSGGGWF